MSSPASWEIRTLAEVSSRALARASLAAVEFVMAVDGSRV